MKKSPFAVVIFCFSLLAMFSIGFLIISGFSVGKNEGSQPKQPIEVESKNPQPEASSLIEPLPEDKASSVDMVALKDELLPIVGEYNACEWYVYVEDFETGEKCYFSWSPLIGTGTDTMDKPLVSASVIKMFVAGAAYNSAGVLLPNPTLDKDIEAMISQSDNNATNAIVEWLGEGTVADGFKAVNSFAAESGFAGVTINRKMGDFTQPLTENTVSVHACAKVLREIFAKKYVNSECSDKLISFLETQSITNKIPSGIPRNSGIKVYNKTGELPNKYVPDENNNGVENDIAVVTAKDGSPVYIICVFSNTVNDNKLAAEGIAEISKATYNAFFGDDNKENIIA
ncbi:MAG: serine hydrolase [Oscillospiraceae bacterium]